MAYYWRCEKHNEVMMERFDKTKTKIIPYCSHCECKKELQQITLKQEKEYEKELERNEREYQEAMQRYQQELLKPSFLKELPVYLVGLVFMGVGIITVVIGLSDGLFSFLGGLIETIIGAYIIYETYVSKPVKPVKSETKKPNKTYITTMF